MLSISILLYFLLRIFVFFPSWWLEAKTKSFSLTVVSQANIFQWMSLLCAHVTAFKGSCMNCTRSPHYSSPVWIKLISPILMLNLCSKKKKKGFWEVWGLFWCSREQNKKNKKTCDMKMTNDVECLEEGLSAPSTPSPQHTPISTPLNLQWPRTTAGPLRKTANQS